MNKYAKNKMVFKEIRVHTHTNIIYMNETNKGNNFFDTNSVRYYYCSKIKD
jgi:hypothetical protein